MFAKNSRYKNLTAEEILNERGRLVESVALRIIPGRSGELSHTVSQVDRLELLAHKYYQDSGKWWLIADANPEWYLPTDIVNRFPMSEYRLLLIITPAITDENWVNLRKELKKTPGIRRFSLDRDEGHLSVELNELVIQPQEINSILATAGFDPADIMPLPPRNGTKIIIPPNENV